MFAEIENHIIALEEAEQKVQALYQALTPTQINFLLFRALGYSADDISRLMNLTPNSVRQYQATIRRQATQIWSPEEIEDRSFRHSNPYEPPDDY